VRTRSLLRGGMVVSMLLLGGCGADNYLDPYQKPYAWHPTGAPTANIAAQLADPHDLVLGRGTTGSDAVVAGQAIDRIWQDKPKPLVAGGSTGPAGGAN